MAIFWPTKITGDIVIYSKWCVTCDRPDELLAINLYALHNNLDVQVIRTAYRPADHKKAIELWSCRDPKTGDDYPIFVVYKDGLYTLEEFVEMIGEDSTLKDKMVKEGKTKDDMQGLPKAKRSKGKTGVGGKAAEPMLENAPKKGEE